VRDVDIVYLCEHIARELDVACAVKYLLESRHGLSVEVLPIQTAAEWATRNLWPKIVAVPYSYRVDEYYNRSFLRRWPGVVVFNLAWEQLLYDAFIEEKMPSDVFAKQYVFHHAWGEFHRERLSNYGVPPERIFVNGQPAYGLYLPPYRDRFPSRTELAKEHGLDPDRRWILFPENYGWGFYPQLRIDTLLRGGMPKETIDNLVNFCRDSVRISLRWCAKLARAHEVEIIVRPRPATLLTDFRQVMTDTIGEPPEGLHLLKEGSVREWILASDTVFSSYSTTLIEAAVAGKRPFMIAPIPLVEELSADWYEHVETVATEDYFLAAAMDPESAGITGRLEHWAKATLLASGDPIDGIARILAGLADPGLERPEIPTRDHFPDRHRAWKVRAAPGEPVWTRLAAAGHRMRFGFRRTFRSVLGDNEDAFILKEREVPEELKKWLDERDLFDATEVDRITGIWKEVLS
jgi:surface carbohydrate biosynthesis protein